MGSVVFKFGIMISFETSLCLIQIKHKEILFTNIGYIKDKMQSVAREVRSLKPTTAMKKLSIRANGKDDTRIVDVRSATLSPPPAIQSGGFSSSFFSERTLTFLGIIASIIALSLALWALHKNSDLTRRLSDINMSVVDLIVESKNTPVVEHSRTSSTSKTIKDKLEAKRLKRQQTRAEAEKPSPISVQHPAQSIVPAIPKFDINTMNADFLATKAQIERQNELAFQETNRRIEEMKRKRIDKNALKEQMNQKPIVQSPQFPTGFIRDPMNKAKIMVDQLTAAGSSFKNVPLIPEIAKEDIDLDDLERDLKLLESGK